MAFREKVARVKPLLNWVEVDSAAIRGNLADFLATVVGLLVDRLGWLPALISGAVFALIGAGLWLLIRTDRPAMAPNVITRA